MKQRLSPPPDLQNQATTKSWAVSEKACCAVLFFFFLILLLLSYARHHKEVYISLWILCGYSAVCLAVGNTFWSKVGMKTKIRCFLLSCISCCVQDLACCALHIQATYVWGLLIVCSPSNEASLDYLTARGVKYLFPVQVKTFQPIYDGKDLIAQARTGTGKTFSFALPLTEKLQSVSQDGKRGRAPKVTYHLRVNTKTLEYGSFQKWFCNGFGDFCLGLLSPFLVFVILDTFLRSGATVWQILQHHSGNTFHV